MSAMTTELTRWQQGKYKFRLLGREYLTPDGRRETEIDGVQVYDTGAWVPVQDVL